MFHLIFRDFLTGFSKRKEERKTKAREFIDKQLKEEKKKVRLEVSISNLKSTSIPYVFQVTSCYRQKGV